MFNCQWEGRLIPNRGGFVGLYFLKVASMKPFEFNAPVKRAAINKCALTMTLPLFVESSERNTEFRAVPSGNVSPLVGVANSDQRRCKTLLALGISQPPTPFPTAYCSLFATHTCLVIFPFLNGSECDSLWQGQVPTSGLAGGALS